MHIYTKILNKNHKNCASSFSILSALKLSLCGVVAFVVTNAYFLTEDRNFKTFLEENYAIASDRDS